MGTERQQLEKSLSGDKYNRPALMASRQHAAPSLREHPTCPPPQADRRAYDLPPLPTPDESRALLMSTRKATPQLALEHPLSVAEVHQDRERPAHYPPLASRRAIYAIVQSITEEAFDYAVEHDIPGIDLERQRGASTHWLRHSYGKTIARRTSSLNSACNLGPADARTTEKHYLDHEEIRRASESERRL